MVTGTHLTYKVNRGSINKNVITSLWLWACMSMGAHLFCVGIGLSMDKSATRDILLATDNFRNNVIKEYIFLMLHYSVLEVGRINFLLLKVKCLVLPFSTS